VNGLSQAAIQLLRKKPTVSVEIDEETYRVMSELARQAGGDIPAILSKLALKYQSCNWLEKQAVIKFILGV
jgi:hypothetical protein